VFGSPPQAKLNTVFIEVAEQAAQVLAPLENPQTRCTLACDATHLYCVVAAGVPKPACAAAKCGCQKKLGCESGGKLC
jgi:hypothetical protein